MTRRRLQTTLAVCAAVLLGLALRVPFLTDPLGPDEAGYLLVARQWHLLDPHLYGRLWVDRPPLLILLFQAADAWGSYGVRLLGVVAVALLATSAGVAGAVVSGRRGAVAGALVAGALASSYATGGQEVDGELLGAPLVMVCCASTLLATACLRRTGPRVLLGALAGVAGACAVLVKQNLADGLVFAAALLLVTLLVEPARRRAATQVLAGGTAGIGAVLLGVVAWAEWSRVGVGSLGYTIYGFRVAAAEVISGHDTTRPLERAALLGAGAVVSGLVALLVQALRRAAPGLRHGDPLSVAVLLTALYGAVGIVAGGSFWTHYLVELVPVAALGVALALRSPFPALPVQRLAVLVVVAAVAATGVGVALEARPGAPETTATTTGAWLRAASLPGDSLMVTYGHPNLVLYSGLRTPYPYLWSLPLRVRDPRLHRMVGTLQGNRAPTWLVEWDDLDAWRIDAHGRLAGAVAAGYHRVATVCGHPVLLRDGVTRRLPQHASDSCTDL